jgi:hypothetical protein
MLVLVLILFCGGSLVASTLSGVPEQLPGVTLGSVPLLFFIRFLIFFGGGIGLLVIASNTWDGRLPAEVTTSGLRYQLSERMTDGVEVLANIDQRLEEQKLQIDAILAGQKSIGLEREL